MRGREGVRSGLQKLSLARADVSYGVQPSVEALWCISFVTRLVRALHTNTYATTDYSSIAGSAIYSAGIDASANNAGAIIAATNRHYSLRTPPHSGYNPICAKRFHQHYGVQPTPNEYSTGTIEERLLYYVPGTPYKGTRNLYFRARRGLSWRYCTGFSAGGGRSGGQTKPRSPDTFEDEGLRRPARENRTGV